MSLEEALCAQPGMNPAWWDYEEFELEALKVCDACPIRLECLKWVDPANSYFDGVAGGYSWQNGKPKYFPGREDKTLLEYWSKAEMLGKSQEIFDEVKMRRYMDGHITWKQMSMEERREACRRMLQAGVDKNRIYHLTHLRYQTIMQIERIVQVAS